MHRKLLQGILVQAEGSGPGKSDSMGGERLQPGRAENVLLKQEELGEEEKS